MSTGVLEYRMGVWQMYREIGEGEGGTEGKRVSMRVFVESPLCRKAAMRMTSAKGAEKMIDLNAEIERERVRDMKDDVSVES